MRFHVPVIFAIVLATSVAHAETAYVNDQFEINLRTGETTQHSILRMLPTGTALEVLGENAQTGYTQVRTQDGRIGFVLSRFLSPQPAARDRLARLQTRYDALREAKQKVDSELTEVKRALANVERERAGLESASAQLSEELGEIRRTAANVLNIDAQNQDLTTRLRASEATIDELRLQNDTLAARSAQWWFMSGGGAVLIGALLGFLLPRVQWRRRSRWGDL